MAPGADGIDTAIVENEEGKSLLVYLRNDSPANEEGVVPPVGSDDPVTTPKNDTDTLLLVAVIVLAVLTVASVAVLVIVVLNPGKKAAKTEKTEDTDVSDDAAK